MRLQHIPLTLEELTDETAATISGGVGIYDIQTLAKNSNKSPFDIFLSGSNREDQTDEDSIHQASEAIHSAQTLAKALKNIL